MNEGGNGASITCVKYYPPPTLTAAVFTDPSNLPTQAEIEVQLKIGAVAPTAFDAGVYTMCTSSACTALQSSEGVKLYTKSADASNPQLDATAIFEISVNNSQRIDLEFEGGSDRFGHHGHELKHTRPPLPANERRQTRWNANPWDVSDGWDGMIEADPGAWLLPYWMARYHGLLANAASATL